MSPHTTQLLGAAATIYGLGGAFSVLLQARRMRARGTSGDVSVRFFAVYVGGFAVWLLYGIGIGDLPVIVVHAVGLVCGTVTLAVAIRLRVPVAVETQAWSGASPDRPTFFSARTATRGPGGWKPGSRTRPDFPAAPAPEETHGEQAPRLGAKRALRPMPPPTPRSLLGTRNTAIAKGGAS